MVQFIQGESLKIKPSKLDQLVSIHQIPNPGPTCWIWVLAQSLFFIPFIYRACQLSTHKDINFSKHISKTNHQWWNWQKKHTCLLLGGGRSNISHWLTVGIEPCKGRIKNLLESPTKLFPFSLSSSLEISSQPVRNTRIAPPASFRHIYSIVASTWKHHSN